ncbi:hypothetical protein CFAM422_005340 [Trichoderma lentiforme]|uniref:Uncharacterized protein n=1 Tax=Trichoderma lentiforme TaxID=1567552 RepID=A0A9P5CC83_9HYPO|nr:hypothetical protein CFAM422_005340 [Trichoderma lentiforme]
MGLFKVRAGDAATLQKQNFSQSELAHSSTPTYAASEEGPQKWADGDYKSSYKPASSASLRSVATEGAASPSQNNSPYHSSGLDANSAAGRLRQVDQFGYSRSTDQISLDSKATISVDRSASTRHLEGRAIRQYHIPYPREISSPASISKNTPTSSSLAPPSITGGDTPTTIGMALGSPSHPPGSAEAPWNQTQVLTTVTSGGDASESNPNPNGMSRSMSKRWNPFSRTKSKRSKPADSPASRAAGTDSGKSMDLGSRTNLSKIGGDRESDRKGSAARKDSSGSLSRHPVPEIPVLPRDTAAPTREAPAPPQIQIEQPKQLQSLLSIEIPTIEMERYSIMFGNILQKQQQQYQYFLQQAQESQPPKEPLEAQVEQTAKLQEVQEAPEVQEVQEVQEIQVPQRPEAPKRPAPSPRPQRSNSKELEKPEEPQESQQSQDSLQSLQQPPQQSPRPSLPDRRQIKIQNLNLPAAKSYRDRSIPIEIVRRGSSPLPESTPSESLAVPNQAPAGNPPRGSSRRRSNTTPAAVVNFPTPAMYKVPAQQRKRTTSVSTPSNDEPPLPAPSDAETTPERRERLISKFHRKESPSEQPSIPKVTDQLSESPASVSTQPQPPQPRSILKKPSGPPPPPPTNRAAEPIAASQEAAPPKHQHQHQMSMASIRTDAGEEEVEKALYEAVEISIARQISVSRQQRKMLVPLNRSTSRRNPGEPAPDAASNIKLDKNKRLVETRTAVPVLVHPASRANAPQGGGGGYRKSSRVVLEGA